MEANETSGKIWTMAIALVTSVFLTACGPSPQPKVATETPLPVAKAASTNIGPTIYFVKGLVKEVLPGNKVVRIKHEEIPGYMAAMTMAFDVKDAKELNGVKAGDEVTFRMLVTEDEGWIDRIAVVGQNTNALAAPLNPLGDPRFRRVRDVDPLAVGDKVPNYPFTNQLGKAVQLSDFQGQAVAVTFIFTRCPFPNFCPRMSENFEQLQAQMKALKDGPTNWHMLSITIDLAFDTPPILKGYAARYKADPDRWSFMTMAQIELDALTDSLNLDMARDEKGFVIDHRLRTLVIDAQGRLQHLVYGNEWKPSEIVEQMVRAARVTSATPAPSAAE